MENKLTTLFLDIGGVLLSNGWDRNARKLCSQKFEIDKQEMEDRHALMFSTYELGKTSFDDYLHFTIFHKERNFSLQDFKNFMYQQSTPIEGAIEYFKALKKQHGFKVVALSNEPKDINEYRIEKFKLTELFDFFISSCYVHLRKPDAEIYQMAIDTSQTKKENCLYVDDRLLYVEMARSLDIPSLHYQNLNSAKEYFNSIKL